MIDLHCHLLPGVDDGAGSPAASLEMAVKLTELGFEVVCCTPHVPWSTLMHSAGEMAAIHDDLRRTLELSGVGLRLYPGAEHHAHEVLERLSSDRLVTYPRGDTFLMEFSLAGFPPRVDELLFRIQVKGKVPVLAHVERYPEVQRDVRALEPLKERGCYVLINLSGLAGAWDRAAERAARAVVEAGLADAASTDMHAAAEAAKVAEGLAVLERLAGADGLERLMKTNPAQIAGLQPDMTGAPGR